MAPLSRIASETFLLSLWEKVRMRGDLAFTLTLGPLPSRERETITEGVVLKDGKTIQENQHPMRKLDVNLDSNEGKYENRSGP